MDPSPTRKGIPLPPEPSRDSQTGEMFENPGDTEGRDRKGSPIRVCGLKECPVLDASRAIGRMSPGQSRPQGGRGVSWNGGPIRISGEPPSMSWHQNVGNVGPKSDHVERSDLAKRLFNAGWERERAKRE
jgi:hypothetical protein